MLDCVCNELDSSPWVTAFLVGFFDSHKPSYTESVGRVLKIRMATGVCPPAELIGAETDITLNEDDTLILPLALNGMPPSDAIEAILNITPDDVCADFLIGIRAGEAPDGTWLPRFLGPYSANPMWGKN
ncbi:hypothetical protein [Solirhodobacter olei]|uniref:hypothetical protein n=1 Tax=Solirhodobacter olei TaxID=2493082 RepID=UPI000FDBA784|nr:hypothetical protein [Solirhodobacter olei]